MHNFSATKKDKKGEKRQKGEKHDLRTKPADTMYTPKLHHFIQLQDFNEPS